MGKADTIKAVTFGCTHAPLHDPEAIDWIVETIAKEKPDVVVHHGDGIEANAASQWDDARELAIELASEYAAHNEILARVRKAAPKAKRIYCGSNHDDNIVKAGRLDPRIRSLCDWRSLKNQPELEHWNVRGEYLYCRSRGCSWITPQVCVGHGFETNPAQMEVEGMYFLLNAPHGLYLTAHTHRPQVVREIVWKGLPLNRWTGNVGTLRDLDSAKYMDRKRRWGWGQACSVVEAKQLKSPRMAKEWDAEIRVFRMFDQVSATKGAA